MPGFVEGHTHTFLGAYFTSGVDLQFPTLQEALDAITAYVAANPTGPLRGFGWRMDMFPPEGPNRQMLDEIVSDRPIMLFAIDVHSLWVNSKALPTRPPHNSRLVLSGVIGTCCTCPEKGVQQVCVGYPAAMALKHVMWLYSFPLGALARSTA